MFDHCHWAGMLGVRHGMLKPAFEPSSGALTSMTASCVIAGAHLKMPEYYSSLFSNLQKHATLLLSLVGKCAIRSNHKRSECLVSSGAQCLSCSRTHEQSCHLHCKNLGMKCKFICCSSKGKKDGSEVIILSNSLGAYGSPWALLLKNLKTKNCVQRR